MAEPSSPQARGSALRGALGLLVVALIVGAVAGARWMEPPADVAASPGTQAPASIAIGIGTVAAPDPPATARPNFTMPPLPLPDQIPTDWYAPTPEVVLGRIKIPRLDVDEPLMAGITLTVVNKGPGWWPGTALPGQLGNMVVAGHRTTYSKPFSRLDELVEGDRVVFAMPDRDYVYAVRGVIVVQADRIGIAAQSYAHTATLFACHPKGSAAQRIVAKLRLLDPDGSPVDKDSWLPALDQGADDAGRYLVMRNPDNSTSSGSGEAPVDAGAANDSTDGSATGTGVAPAVDLTVAPRP